MYDMYIGGVIASPMIFAGEIRTINVDSVVATTKNECRFAKGN